MSAARREDCRPILWAVRDRSSPSPASRSRGPHHGHDPSPNGIAQAVPEGGQLATSVGIASGSTRLPDCSALSADAPAMAGTASPSPAAVMEMTSFRGAAALTCDHQTSRPSTFARIRRRSSSVSKPRLSTTCSILAGSGRQSALPGSEIAVFPRKSGKVRAPPRQLLGASAVRGPRGNQQFPADISAFMLLAGDGVRWLACACCAGFRASHALERAPLCWPFPARHLPRHRSGVTSS